MHIHRYKVLIAEDHRLVAELCKVLLEPEFDVVGIVISGQELIRLALDLRPDVVVLGISTPILNGLDAGKRLKEMHPKVKLVYLTMATQMAKTMRELPGASAATLFFHCAVVPDTDSAGLSGCRF